MASTKTHISGAEAERRAQQSQQSQQSAQGAIQPTTPEQVDQAVIDLGASVGLTPEEAARAEADSENAVAAVNLDEMVVKTIPIKYREFTPITITRDDGTTVTRNQVAVREIELIGDMDAETQLRILAMTQQRPDSKDPQVLSRFYAEQVLIAWQMTDPDMTLDRLLRGLDMVRIRKLGQDFFN